MIRSYRIRCDLMWAEVGNEMKWISYGRDNGIHRKGFESWKCFSFVPLHDWNPSSDANLENQVERRWKILPTPNHNRKMRSYRYRQQIELGWFGCVWQRKKEICYLNTTPNINGRQYKQQRRVSNNNHRHEMKWSKKKNKPYKKELNI